ncbi:MAG: hypothetical protein KKB51_22895 [Candidatus Riflebacteria bacterium]|nr:hypothetical protein [Candidatus Riflebacteria bacterium]
MKVFLTTFIISLTLILGSYYLIIEYQKPLRFDLLEIKDLEALGQLEARQYLFTHKSFLDAIAKDDVEAVSLFVKSGMKTEFAIDYSYKISDNSPYLFYASQTFMLYNPVSLAIIAESGKSLPILLESTENFGILNNLTLHPYSKLKDKNSFDLLALAIRTDNLELLRTLLKAGLKPEKQIYLVVAMHGRKENEKKSPNAHERYLPNAQERYLPNAREISSLETIEETTAFLRAKAEIILELINSGQNIEQRIPIPIPIPTAIEMYFLIAGSEIRENLIARVKDPAVRKKLQAISDKIIVNPPPKKSAE